MWAQILKQRLLLIGEDSRGMSGGTRAQEFVFGKIVKVSTLSAAYVWFRFRHRKVVKTVFMKSEFDLAGSMVDILYIVQLMLLTVMWLPLSIVVYAVMLAVRC
jgi:hypothetical protein